MTGFEDKAHGFEAKAKLIAEELKKRDNFAILYHYDSVTADAEVLAEINNKIERITMDILFKKVAKDSNKITRQDGKEITHPQKVRIFSLGSDGKIKLSRVKSIIKNKTRKKIYNVNSSCGSVKVTEDHSIISLINNKIAYAKPNEASHIASPSYYPSTNQSLIISLKKEKLLANRQNSRKRRLPEYIKLDKKLMTFFGLWLADGCYQKNKGREGIHVSSYKDRECAKIIDYVFKLFDAKNTITDKGITAQTSSKTMYNFMNYLKFNGLAHNKRVPAWVYGISKELKAGLISGYFSGDGTVSKGDIDATSKSLKLLEDIQTLLLFFGIRAHIRKDGIYWKISINDATFKRKFIKDIRFLQKYKNNKIKVSGLTTQKFDRIPFTKEFLKNLKAHTETKMERDVLTRCIKHKLSISRYKLEKILKDIKNNNLKREINKLLQKEVFWEKYKTTKISNKSLTEVYDIETSEGNFICNNLILKNSDGICAGAIIAKAFQRLGKTFKTKSVKQLYRETIEEIKDMGENYVFVDFGSVLIDELKESFGNNFFVLDHHQPKGLEYEFHLNPFEFGINGGDEISGSGVTYEVAKHLGENSDLSALAVVGALGDMQDFKGSLIGKNREIMNEAIKSNVLEVRKDLRLYGRISRPLTQFLCFSSNPILPELTANEPACVDFLKIHDLDIRDNGRWVSYDDLSSENKKKLTTALILHLQSYNTPEWKLRELIGDVFILKNEPSKTPLRDAKEFSTLLNSCGRHGEAETALKVCMGDRDEYYSRALSLLAEHRKQLREGIEFMTDKGVEEMETFYFFDAGSKIKDSIVGIVAGMLYGSGAIQGNKPIVAFAMHEDNTVKISTRGTSELLRKGLNLGLALKETCAKLGENAQGGGHKIAAGAKINENQKQDFLKIFNENLKNQFTN